MMSPPDKMIPRINTFFIFAFGVMFAMILSFVSKLDQVLKVGITSDGLLYKFTLSESESSIFSNPSNFDDTPNHSIGFSSLSHKVKNDAVKEDLTVEALASLHMANEMRRLGKSEKAQRLFLHALQLAPFHPDILNEYGEFLEEIQNDVVKAEHLYTKALTVSPEHSEALMNRKRTLPLVEKIDQSNFNRIDNKRDQLFKVPENNAAFRRAKKEAYFHHIYHTVAIEGNTMTLLQTRMIVETRMAIGGKSVMEHNEILGMEAALSFINNTLLQRIGVLTIQNILDIQKRVLGFVDPIEAGHFRTTQVFIGEYVPPHPSNVHPMMEAFVEWLNSEEAMNLHPIEYAALAHYKLVFIHPFIDGNGRTSRLLMNLILMQAGYPPVVIKVDERLQYYDYLKEANDGDVRPFIRFVARCTERTLDEYLYVTTEYPGQIRELDSTYGDRIIIVD